MKKILSARFVSVAVAVGVLILSVAGIARAGVVIPQNNDSFLGLPDLVPGGIAANTHRAVLYNHGGMGDLVGGDLSQNVEMLADAGFIAYAKKRTGTSIAETLEEVEQGLAELMNLSLSQLEGRAILGGSDDPGVSLIGYSRGALMSLGVAELQVDGGGTSRQIDKVILMAMAPGSNKGWTEGGATSPSQVTTADQYLSPSNLALIDEANTEFLMMVAANDKPPNNKHDNLVDLMMIANDRMVNRSGTPVTSTVKIYDSWMPPNTGHNLFHNVPSGGQDLVNQEGYYWYDVIRFLNNKPIDTEYTTLIPEPNAAAFSVLGVFALAIRRRRAN